jgi:hypothetical protein
LRGIGRRLDRGRTFEARFFNDDRFERTSARHHKCNMEDFLSIDVLLKPMFNSQHKSDREAKTRSAAEQPLLGVWTEDERLLGRVPGCWKIRITIWLPNPVLSCQV